jgi:hypothetical protein
MTGASFSLDFDLSVTCVRCGIDRDFPENDQPMPSESETGVTVFADSPCGCGAKRVLVRAMLGDDQD